MDLLAAEMTVRTGKDPGELYRELTARFGTPCYTRIDVPATPAEEAAMERLSPETIKGDELAGEPILAKLSSAPGNGAPIGGLKESSRQTDGLRPDRRERRTSTRSMRRVSKTRPIWKRSSEEDQGVVGRRWGERKAPYEKKPRRLVFAGFIACLPRIGFLFGFLSSSFPCSWGMRQAGEGSESGSGPPRPSWRWSR